MVTWSEDVNLEYICEGINKYIANYKMQDYYIYGLQQETRPHVRITPSCPPELIQLFEKSGYTLEVKPASGRYCGDCDAQHSRGDCCCDEGDCDLCNPNIVTIGLRRDIRNNITISRKLIKTIIFGMERKLVLNNKAKLNLGRKVSRKAPEPVPVTKIESKTESPVIGLIQRLEHAIAAPPFDWAAQSDDSNEEQN